MCVCNCASVNINEKYPVPTGIKYKARTGLFNWITILLITGWILVVAVATTNVQDDRAAGDQSARTFIKEML